MKPILFNTDMVRALLDGRKTVTRRVIKDKDIINAWDCESDGTPIAFIDRETGDSHPPAFPCQYQPGDILYVRETWRIQAAHRFEADARIEFKAGGPLQTIQFPGSRSQGTNRIEYDEFLEKWLRSGWRPSIHMPNEAARLFLRVTAVQVERLQDINGLHAKEEGCEGYLHINPLYGCPETVHNFKVLWNSTIKTADLPLYGWDANPWVWVIEFERVSKEAALKGGED